MPIKFPNKPIRGSFGNPFQRKLGIKQEGGGGWDAAILMGPPPYGVRVG
jgi:hypothetical protein